MRRCAVHQYWRVHTDGCTWSWPACYPRIGNCSASEPRCRARLVLQTNAYATVVSVGAGRPPVYQVGPAFPALVTGRSGRLRPLQVRVRGGELEAHAEAELIGLAEELGEWLCVALRARSGGFRRWCSRGPAPSRAPVLV